MEKVKLFEPMKDKRVAGIIAAVTLTAFLSSACESSQEADKPNKDTVNSEATQKTAAPDRDKTQSAKTPESYTFPGETGEPYATVSIEETPASPEPTFDRPQLECVYTQVGNVVSIDVTKGEEGNIYTLIRGDDFTKGGEEPEPIIDFREGALQNETLDDNGTNWNFYTFRYIQSHPDPTTLNFKKIITDEELVKPLDFAYCNSTAWDN